MCTPKYGHWGSPEKGAELVHPKTQALGIPRIDGRARAPQNTDTGAPQEMGQSSCTPKAAGQAGTLLSTGCDDAGFGFVQAAPVLGMMSAAGQEIPCHPSSSSSPPRQTGFPKSQPCSPEMHSSDSGSGAGGGLDKFGGARGPYGDTQLRAPLGSGHRETSATSSRDRVTPLCATSDVATRPKTTPKPPQNAPGLCAAGSWPGQSCGFPETAGSRLPAGGMLRGQAWLREPQGPPGTGWDGMGARSPGAHPGEPTSR